jgi:hypothetical protein
LVSAVRHALAEALGVEPVADVSLETVDVRGAAALLHTTAAAIYTRRHAGKMPRPISKRPLVWRRADLLAMEDT